MSNSLNLISFFHASNMKEASHKPVVIPTLHKVEKTPCVMDIVDRLEQCQSELGEGFQSTLLSSSGGSRHHFQIVSDKQADTIDSPATVCPGMGELTSDELADQIVSQWKPGAYNLVHVRGHGHAHEDVMGMPTNDFVKGLKKAKERLGQPIPTLLMESCLMSNLEVLNGMAGSVQTVIASEEVLKADALPHREMFGSVLSNSSDPKEVAQNMVEVASKEGKADTLVALDVDRIPEVKRNVDDLKSCLGADHRKPLAKEARRVMKESKRFPRYQFETHYRRKLDLRDLGEVAGSLQSAGLDQTVAAKAEKILDSVAGATLAMTRGEGYESASGLSVRSSSIAESSGWNFFGLFS